MFDEIQGDEIFGMSGALEALAELERNTSDAILAQRSSERIEIQTKVLIQPGNVSERHYFTIEGVTADISNGGCMLLLSGPIMVGDLFWITFDDEQIHIGSLIVRCLRCRLVREDAFETGIRFLQDVDVAGAVRLDHHSLV